MDASTTLTTALCGRSRSTTGVSMGTLLCTATGLPSVALRAVSSKEDRDTTSATSGCAPDGSAPAVAALPPWRLQALPRAQLTPVYATARVLRRALPPPAPAGSVVHASQLPPLQVAAAAWVAGADSQSSSAAVATMVCRVCRLMVPAHTVEAQQRNCLLRASPGRQPRVRCYMRLVTSQALLRHPGPAWPCPS